MDERRVERFREIVETHLGLQGLGGKAVDPTRHHLGKHHGHEVGDVVHVVNSGGVHGVITKLGPLHAHVQFHDTAEGPKRMAYYKIEKHTKKTAHNDFTIREGIFSEIEHPRKRGGEFGLKLGKIGPHPPDGEKGGKSGAGYSFGEKTLKALKTKSPEPGENYSSIMDPGAIAAEKAKATPTHVPYKGGQVPVDPTPYPIKPFEASRPYVMSHEGRRYVMVMHTDSRGTRAHPVDESEK